ncbi:hypothetical protein F4810DRAFT_649937 [Camillea tinctor]|nr:hypothetical protein F4810DRAFT_649937 [Camillea tinctor]
MLSIFSFFQLFHPLFFVFLINPTSMSTHSNLHSYIHTHTHSHSHTHIHTLHPALPYHIRNKCMWHHIEGMMGMGKAAKKPENRENGRKKYLSPT